MKAIKFFGKTLILVIILQIIVLPTISKAADPEKSNPLDEILHQAESFIKQGKKQQIIISDPGGSGTRVMNDPINMDALQETQESMYNVLLEIGIVVALLVLPAVGITIVKTSAKEKVDTVKILQQVVVVIFCIFAAYGIWRLAVAVLSKLTTL